MVINIPIKLLCHIEIIKRPLYSTRSKYILVVVFWYAKLRSYILFSICMTDLLPKVQFRQTRSEVGEAGIATKEPGKQKL